MDISTSKQYIAFSYSKCYKSSSLCIMMHFVTNKQVSQIINEDLKSHTWLTVLRIGSIYSIKFNDKLLITHTYDFFHYIWHIKTASGRVHHWVPLTTAYESLPKVVFALPGLQVCLWINRNQHLQYFILPFQSIHLTHYKITYFKLQIQLTGNLSLVYILWQQY